MEFEVLYDWEAENEQDLSLFAGETVVVLERFDHGWWLGSIDRDGQVVNGYFPRNYVKPKPAATSAPPPPPRPMALPTPAAVSPGGDQLASGMEQLQLDNRNSAQRRSSVTTRSTTFSLRSLPAFDALIERGFAVEVDNSETTGEVGDVVIVGARKQVTVEVTAGIWDAANGAVHDFVQGSLTFVTAAPRPRVVQALDEGVQSLRVGQTAMITAAPQAAYGAAGHPPSVPANAYIIFRVKVLTVAEVGGSEDDATGPAALIINDPIITRRQSLSLKRSSRIILHTIDEESATA